MDSGKPLNVKEKAQIDVYDEQSLSGHEISVKIKKKI